MEQTTLEAVTAHLESNGVDDTQLAALRGQFENVHFTYCSDDDVSNGKPVVKRSAFNLYLVDGSDHCLQITSSLEGATGLVVAEVEPDE